MTPIFLDTVGLLAVWDEDDQWHAAASRVHGRLLAERRVFVTTPFVLAECANAAARRFFRRDVFALREQLEARERLLFTETEDWHAAWTSYAADPPGGPGLVDQLSFAVMLRYGLREAFTNDRHFRDAGFEPLF